MTSTQKHTHLQTAQANTQTKVCKSVCFSATQEKMFLKNPHAQKNKTQQPHNPTLTSILTASTLPLSDRVTGQGRRRASANSGFKKLAVQCLIEHLFFASSVVLAESFVFRNRQLLKPAKRYGQVYET